MLPDQTAQTYQDGRQQLPPTPAPTPEKDTNSGLLKILLATVVGLVALMAVGTVVLLVSQSNVSTHINRSTSQNTSSSNATTTNKATKQPQTVVVQPQTTTVQQVPAPATTTPVPPTTNQPTFLNGLPANTRDTEGRYDMYSGDSISGDFARAILTAAANYQRDNGSLPNGVDITVYSPTTGQDYQVSYSNDGTVETAYNTSANSGDSEDNEVAFYDSLLTG